MTDEVLTVDVAGHGEVARRKYKVFLAFLTYGGVSGSPVVHPEIKNWGMKSAVRLSNHPLVESFSWKDFNDTPAPMVRNQAAHVARVNKYDILIMIDSDMLPDMYLLPPYNTSIHSITAKPFLDVAIDIIDQWYDKGPVVIGAPYCGPPPEEYPYVFTWDSWPSEGNDKSIQLRMMTRKEAYEATGVQSVAALPTGLIAYDVRAFEYTVPKEDGDKPWFYYEYMDKLQVDKTGTEDVMNTRDLALAIQGKLGYNPLKCAWDCWAGHMKPRVVGKPTPTPVSGIDAKYRRSVLENVSLEDRVLEMGEPQPRF